MFNLKEYADTHRDKPQREVVIRAAREGRAEAAVTVRYLGRKLLDSVPAKMAGVPGLQDIREHVATQAIFGTLAGAVVGWRGLGPKVVAELIPVDPSELPFAPVNVAALLENSPEFRNLVLVACQDLVAMRRADYHRPAQNTPPAQVGLIEPARVDAIVRGPVVTGRKDPQPGGPENWP